MTSRRGHILLMSVSPHLRSEWNPTKNCSLKPDEVSYGSNKKVWWICPKGHEWEATAKDRHFGYGCPGCSGRMVTVENSIDKKFPQLRQEWHTTKNGNLKFEEVCFGSHKKFWWVCKEGHEWLVSPNSRTNGSHGTIRGCPFCSGNLMSSENSLRIVRPDLEIEFCNVKNTVKFHTLCYGSQTKVWWVCSKGHSYESSPKNRVSSGQNCPYCSKNRVSDLNSLPDRAPSLLLEWHFAKNEGLKFEEVSVKSSKKVWWICKEGHEWLATIANRSSGSGCPYCIFRHSKAEIEIFKIVQFSFPDSINGQRRLLKTKKFELDIWLPSLRKGIEYNGRRFHLKPEGIERDARKALQCKEAGIQLLIITDTEYEADKTAALLKIFKFLEGPDLL